MTEFNLSKSHKPLEAAEKALNKAQAEYDAKRETEMEIRARRTDIIERAKLAAVPPDPVALEDIDMELRVAVRERTIAGHDLEQARKVHDAAFRDAIAKLRPEVQDAINGRLTAILEAGEALAAAIDDLDEYERGWSAATRGHGALRADPAGDVCWRFLQLSLGRTPIGQRLDELVSRFGRKQYAAEDAA